MRYTNRPTLYSTVLLFLLFPAFGFAQNNEAFSKKDISDIFSRSGVIQTKTATQTSGSPYLNDKFIEGNLVGKGGGKTATVPLRYNMEKNQVEFLRNKKVLITDTKQLKGFNFNTKGDDIEFRNGYDTNVKDIDSDTFLNVVYNGKVKFLVLYKAILHKNLPTYGTAVKKNKYEAFKKYYLVTTNGEFHQLKSVKTDVLNTLSGKKNELTKFADSNSLDFENESDLVKILTHYDKISN